MNWMNCGETVSFAEITAVDRRIVVAAWVYYYAISTILPLWHHYYGSNGHP